MAGTRNPTPRRRSRQAPRARTFVTRLDAGAVDRHERLAPLPENAERSSRHDVPTRLNVPHVGPGRERRSPVFSASGVSSEVPGSAPGGRPTSMVARAWTGPSPRSTGSPAAVRSLVSSSICWLAMSQGTLTIIASAIGIGVPGGGFMSLHPAPRNVELPGDGLRRVAEQKGEADFVGRVRQARPPAERQ